MPTTEQVMEALSHVQDPELGRDLVSLKMIRDLVIRNGVVAFTLYLTILNCPLREHMAKEAREALLKLPGVEQVQVEFGSMSEEERKEVLSSSKRQLPKLASMNKIGQVFSVMSGKGGVGKSSVTAMLAVELARRGQKVGILDADITGASIPKLFGLPAGGLRGGDLGILPAFTPLGIRIVSSNLMLKEEDAAVAWRGPLIAGMIQKFWDDVLWGRQDTLLVDLPPGTSDATITVMQNLPINGVMLVSTPQELSGLVVRKAAHLMNRLDVPILGIVENMSFYRCPKCGEEHAIFGASHSAQLATDLHTELITRLPLDPTISEQCDRGHVEAVVLPEMAALAKLIT
jgi:Mrp family chromosome partitioning ATPase